MDNGYCGWMISVAGAKWVGGVSIVIIIGPRTLASIDWSQFVYNDASTCLIICLAMRNSKSINVVINLCPSNLKFVLTSRTILTWTCFNLTSVEQIRAGNK